MRIIHAIIGKQLKDTFKNKAVFIQFVMFPLLTIIMNSAIEIEGMADNFFVNLFSSMYIGMAPLISMASIISEEKEKNTLRVLLMSNVKPLQYLIGIGGYIWLLCMLGSSVFCIVGNYDREKAFYFMLLMGVGILISILIGAAIGCGCKNQMSATSITVPVMMIFAFLPMLSMFNNAIKRVAKITYSEQINLMVQELEMDSITLENIIVILANIIITFALFYFTYKKNLHS